MSKFNMVAMGCALALSAAGLEAAPVEDGMKACADAMVQKLSETGSVSKEYALEPGRKFVAKHERLRSRDTFHMDVRSAENNEVMARVDCVVNGRAEVLELNGLPLVAEDASLRAVSVY